MIYIQNETFEKLSKKTKEELENLKIIKYDRPKDYAMIMPFYLREPDTKALVKVNQELLWDIQDEIVRHNERKELKELRELRKNLNEVKNKLNGHLESTQQKETK